MKFPARFAPEAMASGGIYKRYAFEAVSVQELGGKAVAISSDGRALLRVEVELEEGDVLGCYPRKAFELAAQIARLTGSDPQIKLRGDHCVVAGMKLDAQKGAAYPDCDIPIAGEAKPIMLDAQLLLRMAKALGAVDHDHPAGGVILEIRGNDEPIVVRPMYEGNASGLLMTIVTRKEGS